jgi:ribosomal protein L37AE/L43A
MGRKKQKVEKSEAAQSQDKLLLCPVCLSDNLDLISVRMKKCKSCGFIWNHEVSDRDNLLLILEHQAKRADKRELAATAPSIPFVASKSSRKPRS